MLPSAYSPVARSVGLQAFVLGRKPWHFVLPAVCAAEVVLRGKGSTVLLVEVGSGDLRPAVDAACRRGACRVPPACRWAPVSCDAPQLDIQADWFTSAGHLSPGQGACSMRDSYLCYLSWHNCVTSAHDAPCEPSMAKRGLDVGGIQQQSWRLVQRCDPWWGEAALSLEDGPAVAGDFEAVVDDDAGGDDHVPAPQIPTRFEAGCLDSERAGRGMCPE